MHAYTTATPGARVARSILLRSDWVGRPRPRIWRAAHPRTNGLPPTRANTDYVPKCVPSPLTIHDLLILFYFIHLVPKRQRRPIQGYEDVES